MATIPKCECGHYFQDHKAKDWIGYCSLCSCIYDMLQQETVREGQHPLADYLPAPNLVMCMTCGNVIATGACVCSVPVPWGSLHRDGVQADDPISHPSHYTSHPSGVECIQITEHMNFCLGNALKYIWRADLKQDSIEDLQKSVWYLNREIERRRSNND